MLIITMSYLPKKKRAVPTVELLAPCTAVCIGVYSTSLYASAIQEPVFLAAGLCLRFKHEERLLCVLQKQYI